MSTLHHYSDLEDPYDKKLLLRLRCDIHCDPVCALRTSSAKTASQKRIGARKVRHIEIQAGADNKLTPESATEFKALSARINHLSQDGPSEAVAAKELYRDFATPTAAS